MFFLLGLSIDLVDRKSDQFILSISAGFCKSLSKTLNLSIVIRKTKIVGGEIVK